MPKFSLGFNAEQSVQLYLKSIILEFSGEIPKTHSIRELLRIIDDLTNCMNVV